MPCKKRDIVYPAKAGDLIDGGSGVCQIPAGFFKFFCDKIRHGGGIVSFPEKFGQSIFCNVEFLSDTFQIFIFFRGNGQGMGDRGKYIGGMDDIAFQDKEISKADLDKLVNMLSNETDEIDIYDADLTFKGLKLIYDRNHNHI